MAKQVRARPTDIGALVEDRALKLLNQAGLELLSRNFRCRFGEIDLIMRDEATIVFVEVRHRASARFGSAAETISPAKQRRLRLTAQWFLVRGGYGEHDISRFDVVTSDGPVDSFPSLHWQQAALWFDD